MSRHAYLLVLSRHERGHRRFVQLPDATVLGWFRRNWRRTTEQRAKELQGDVYGLDSVFDDNEHAAPKSDDALVAEIHRSLYSEGGHEARTHYVAVETDDDEVPIHYYFFDDDFLETPDAWDELPDWRTGTALRVIRDSGDDNDDDDEEVDEEEVDEEEVDEDEEKVVRADAFETFYRQRRR